MTSNALRTDTDADNRTDPWGITDDYNIAIACCERHARARPHAIAVLDATDLDAPVTTSFDSLNRLSNRAANMLASFGIARGDRVALMLPQAASTLAIHLGLYRLGALAVPMARQFGSTAVAYRMEKSRARMLITDSQTADRLADMSVASAQFQTVLIAGDSACDSLAGRPCHALTALLNAAGDETVAPAAGRDDPAMLLFTSGTTGPAKAAIHAHRVVAGHVPGVILSQNGLAPGQRFWTPSDWAWAGGLLNGVLTALHLGVTIVAARADRFRPERAAKIIKRAGVTNAFMPPTAIRLMLADGITGKDGPGNLKGLGVAGEALGGQTLERIEHQWGVRANEFYGQTECNTVIGSAWQNGVCKPGSMGKATPGHRVAVLRDDGTPAAPGETGQIAIARPDPTMFLGYDGDEEATAAKFSGDWLLTGDEAMLDADGYFHFIARSDDIITTSGYRVGPSEIEDVLVAHPDVRLAAVTGIADTLRTEAIQAHVVLRDGATLDAQMIDNLQTMVRERLGPFLVPKSIHAVAALPVTESGKVIRRALRHPAGQV